MKRVKQCLCLLMAAVLLAAAIHVFAGTAAASAPTVVQSGRWGADNVTFKLYSDGKLVIGGTGAMPDGYSDGLPNVTSMVIEPGITSIGSYACNALALKLRSVQIPESVTRIGENAFKGCSLLSDVYYMGANWDRVTVNAGNEKLLNARLHIAFGGYPQTEETDEAVVAQLNAQVSDEDWVSYGYYSGRGDTSSGPYGDWITLGFNSPWYSNGTQDESSGEPGDWMKFCDTWLNGEKYRGVRFSKYRPMCVFYGTAAANSKQPQNGYLANTTYWFRWEPLTWRVLDDSTGLVLCDRLIDAQAFQNKYWGQVEYIGEQHIIVEGNRGGYYIDNFHYFYYGDHGYANNYKHSTVRSWLNDGFYNAAFSATEQAMIASSAVDNSMFRPSGQTEIPVDYGSGSTTDKLFLLTYADAVNADYGFEALEKRMAYGTDYAKCQGLAVSAETDSLGYSEWLLRQAGYVDSNEVCIIGSEGIASARGYTCYTDYGVRPAFRFSGAVKGSLNPYGGTLPWDVTGSGKLRILGPMGNYTTTDPAPWQGQTFTTVEIDPGVTEIGDYAFYGCSSITEVTIPDTVSRIGVSAFNGCTRLQKVNYGGSSLSWTELDIGNNNVPLVNAPKTYAGVPGYCGAESGGTNLSWEVTGSGKLRIRGEGDMADFANGAAPWYGERGRIRSIEVDTGVTSIGSYAFAGLTKAAELSLPGNLSRIGERALENTAWLEAQPDGLVYAGWVAYTYKGSMPANTSITLKNGSTGIADYAFANRDNLVSLTLSSGVRVVGKNALQNCAGLTRVLGVSVLYPVFEEYAFAGCTSLTDVMISRDTKAIRAHAFAGCTSLENVLFNGSQSEWNAIPKGSDNEPLLNATLNLNAYTGTCGKNGTNLTYIYFPNGTLIISGEGEMKNYDSGVTAPPWPRSKVTSVIVEPGVTSIGEYAFYNSKLLTDVSLSDTVAKIGDCAFCYCEALSRLSLGEGLTEVGRHAFDRCAVTELMFAENLTALGDYAFQDCAALTRVALPDSLTAIGGSSFLRCEQLESVTFGNQLTSIGSSAFSGCHSLKNVVLPSTVTYIGAAAFAGCKISSIALPQALTRIYSNTFLNCAELTEITIPENVTEISDSAFERCTSLAKVCLPASLTKVGNDAFADCTALRHVYYCGSPEQRAAMTIGETGNDALVLNSAWHYAGPLAAENVTLSWTSRSYNGAAQQPQVTVKNSAGETLAQGVDYTVTYAPGCKAEGAYTVTVVGAGYYTDSVQKLFTITEHSPHTWDEGTTLRPATCTEEGLMRYSCTLDGCGRVKTEPIPVNASAHAGETEVRGAKAATCSAEGYTGDTCCKACGDVVKKGEAIAKKAHTYKNVVTKATLAKDGKITPTCSVCGATKTATKIAKASKISVSKTKYVYNGKVQKPTLTVKDSTGKTISTKYYTVTWSNASSKTVGKYTVTVTFKGNYSGTKTLTYTIVPKAVTGVKNAAPATKSIKLSWTKATGAKYYEVYGSTDGKTFKKITTVSTTSAKITKVNGKALAAGKTYYFKVRALDSTKKLTGAYSKVLKTGTKTAAPKLTKLTSTKSKTATATWGKVTGAKSYVVYRSADGKKWTKAGTTAETSFTLSKLTGGKKIYVKVLAVNAYKANSAYSATKYVTVKK